MPELKLDKIMAARCLLLGSRNPGCACSVEGPPGLGSEDYYPALVDNGKVSYSNSVRQSLFTFTDCQEGREMRLKAVAAADHLSEKLVINAALGSDSYLVMRRGVRARGVELEPGVPLLLL